MCSERDSPLEPFVLLAPGQPELARLICGAHLGPPVLTRKQKHPRVNSLVCDRVAAFSVAGPPEVLSRMSRPVTQAAERERELARACSQRLKQAAPSLPGESVSRGFADRGDLEGYPSHYTSLDELLSYIGAFMLDVTLTHHIPAIWTCEIGDMEIYQNVHNRRDIDLCQNDKQPQITLVPKFITWINLAFPLRIISLCLMWIHAA